MRKRKKIGKDAYYLDVEDIFPIEVRTTEETQFLEQFIDKIHVVDLGSEHPEDFIISTKGIVLLLTRIIKEWNSFKEKS